MSKSLLLNIAMFCRIWNIWFPDRYKPITIKAKEISDDYRPQNKRMIATFSGGLDSLYLLYKYKKNLDPVFKYDIDKSVMLFGADIPLEDRAQFNIAFNNAKKITDDLGVELIPVETNYRKYTVNWPYEFGSVIAATLGFFSKTYFYGRSASDWSILYYDTPWGTNPITDQYLSSDTFRFVIDGYEHTRTERAAVVKDWKVGLENLRVCWRNHDKSKNCGKCEKCVCTKLNFMAVGVNHLPSMPNDLTKEELLNDNLIQMRNDIIEYQDIYKYNQQHNLLQPEWNDLLAKRIKIWDKRFTSNKRKNKLSLARLFRFK